MVSLFVWSWSVLFNGNGRKFYSGTYLMETTCFPSSTYVGITKGIPCTCAILSEQVTVNMMFCVWERNPHRLFVRRHLFNSSPSSRGSRSSIHVMLQRNNLHKTTFAKPNTSSHFEFISMPDLKMIHQRMCFSSLLLLLIDTSILWCIVLIDLPKEAVQEFFRILSCLFIFWFLVLQSQR